ncbi:MAG: hypothetical protein ACE5HC_15895 [Candidatus Binatia bacterium]
MVPDCRRKILTSTLIVFLAAPKLSFGIGEFRQGDPTSKAMGLELKVTTDKKVYKLGEAILVTIAIRNTGEQTLLLTAEPVTRPMNRGILSILEVEVRNARGEALKRERGLGSSVGWRGDMCLYEFIHSTRSLFRPSDSRSFTMSLDRLGFELDQPGNYRLRATYHEPSYRDSVTDEEFEQLKKRLEVPWWAEVESDWVWIEIVE